MGKKVGQSWKRPSPDASFTLNTIISHIMLFLPACSNSLNTFVILHGLEGEAGEAGHSRPRRARSDGLGAAAGPKAPGSCDHTIADSPEAKNGKEGSPEFEQEPGSPKLEDHSKAV